MVHQACRGRAALTGLSAPSLEVNGWQRCLYDPTHSAWLNENPRRSTAGNPRAGREPDAGAGADHGRGGVSGERKLAKPGEMLAEDALLEVRGKDHPWVSRGGIKLDSWARPFRVRCGGRGRARRGRSTGGFTECCSRAGRRRSMRSMSGPTSWRGSCGRTRASSCLSRPTRGTRPMSRCPSRSTSSCATRAYRARQGARGAAQARQARREAGRADQAAVRGRARGGRQGRRRPRRGGAPARLREAADGSLRRAGRCSA